VIVLAEGTRRRERGNAGAAGFLIEYFANSAAQIRAYFAEDHASHRHVMATLLLTGQVIFDKHGVAPRLVREATRWHRRPLPKLTRAGTAQAQYALWDTVDSVLDAIDRDSPDVPFQYYHATQSIYESYARHLRQPVLPPTRLWGVLGTYGRPERYLLDAFPDADFVRLLRAAIRETDPARMPRRLERLSAHVQRALGGFEIDGFKLRTPSV
jgi:hypothetical protein